MECCLVCERCSSQHNSYLYAEWCFAAMVLRSRAVMQEPPLLRTKCNAAVTASQKSAAKLQLAAVKTLASKLGTRMQSFEYRSVRYWSKEIDETLTEGRKKIIFLIRDIDGPAMTAAPEVADSTNREALTDHQT